MNRTPTGQYLTGHRFSEETKAKISSSRKGQLPWNTGRIMPEEFKQKMSDVKTGKIGRKRKIATSPYRGVSWSTQKRCWKTQIRIDGVDCRNGSYKNEVAAAIAVDELLVSKGKKRLNFPTPPTPDWWFEMRAEKGLPKLPLNFPEETIHQKPT